MKKVVLLGAGMLAAGSVALVGSAVAASDPANGGSLNVVGEPYNKAISILKSQGVKATFGGSFGGVLPQAQCLVNEQKFASGKVILMLDCSQAAAEQLKDMAGSGRTVGSNGVTTVTPTPVVPIAGAPGAGTPPPA